MSRNEQARKKTKELQPRQMAAIAALLLGSDVQSTAAKCGVPVSTLRRWISMDALFRATLQAEERAVIDDVARRLAGTAEAAVSVIRAIMADKEVSATVRLRAAQTALEQLMRLRELVNVEGRLAALEASVEAQNNKEGTK